MGIQWRFQLLGGLQATSSDQVLARFQTRKTALLLAFLAYERQPYSREVLIDLLWPDADPEAARDRLTQALVWLRPRLEPPDTPRGCVLETDRSHVGLNPSLFVTDVLEFRAAARQALQAQPLAEQSQAIAHALTLYPGPLLPEFYEDWVLRERQRLQEQYLQLLHLGVVCGEQTQDFAVALDYARQSVVVDPLHEEAHCDLIRVLAADRQVAAALRQFEELKRLLKKELDAEPSPAAQALIANIRATTPSPPASESPALPPLPLPAPLTRFFGRTTEVERLRRCIQTQETRLVTLIGPGGSGKTRLALEALRSMTPAFPGTPVFIPLADLQDAALIPAAIAHALRLAAPTGAVLEQVIRKLQSGPYLLVLDNSEHLMPDAATLVRNLLAQATTLMLLVTSRQRLGVEGEQEFPVLPLAVPDAACTREQLAQFDSVRLFLDRARAARPGFELTAENAAAIAGVCERLEGIPLAIELCAAWGQTLTPAQMLAKLAQRFALLISRRTDITPRHRTLRAALEYSYIQLPKDLAKVFARLAVFRGGWTLEAAMTVCLEDRSDLMAALEVITELRERSLVVAEEQGTEMRYRMLESLREFAGEQLMYAESALRRKAHTDYFLHLAEQAQAGMAGPEQDRSLALLDADQENLRAALTWSEEAGEIERGLRLCNALASYWVTRGRLREGSGWLKRLLERAADAEKATLLPVSVVAGAWNAYGHLAWIQADYSTAQKAHEEALARRQETEDLAGIIESLYHLGITAYRQDDFATAQRLLEQSLTLARQRDDPASIARVLLNLGNIAYEEQRHDEARHFFQQSLQLEQALGNRQRVANALNNLGLVAIAETDYPTAEAFYEEAVAIRRELTDNYGITFELANLGYIVRMRGQKQRARALLTEGLKIAYDLGHSYIMVHYLLLFGILEAEEGHDAEGVLLISGAQHLSEKMGSARRITDADGCEAVLETAHRALGERGFETFWAQGQTIALEKLVALALKGSPAS